MTREQRPPTDLKDNPQGSASSVPNNDWRVVGKKTKPAKVIKTKPELEKNKKRKKPPLPDAIAVKPGDGESVATIIRTMTIDIETTGAQVASISES